ncbi:Acyl-CoA dehydrogenase [Pseudomonas sp. IT-P100]
MDSSVFDQTQFLLGASIPCPRGLTQKVLADSAIPGIPAFAAHQLAETALRGHYAFSGRLLEQSPGEVFDVAVFTQARAVEQPLGHTHRKALGRGNTGRCRGYRNGY